MNSEKVVTSVLAVLLVFTLSACSSETPEPTVDETIELTPSPPPPQEDMGATTSEDMHDGNAHGGSPAWLKPEYRNTNAETEGEANALYSTLEDFFSDKSTQYIQALNEQERIAFVEDLKDAYISGFERDAYSRFLPFNSDYVRRVLDLCRFELFNDYGVFVGVVNIEQGQGNSYNWYVDDVLMSLGTLSFDFDMASNFMHEMGHLLGLGEGLTMLLEYEYRSFMLSDDDYNDLMLYFVCDMPHDWRYESCFFDLLLQRVDATVFWEAAFTSQSAFEILWDDNIELTSFQTLFESIKMTYFALIVEMNSFES